jgi:predicted outer membrane repeat protein
MKLELTVQCLEDRIAPANFIAATPQQLIDAILVANTNSQPDTITLTAPQLVFADDFNDSGNALPPIVRDGSPSNKVTIDGRGAVLDRSVSGTPPFRFFQVESGFIFPERAPATLILNDLTLRGGRVSGNGGAILVNGGSATLSHCTFIGNQAVGTSGSGGAIYAVPSPSTPTPQLFIDHCTFQGNGAGLDGGAISTGTLTTITSSTFENNTAQIYGGAIDVFANTVEIRGSTIGGPVVGGIPSGNQAIQNVGGGIAATGGTLTLINSTVSGNRAPSGGGIGINNLSGQPTVAILHSTITSNTVFAATGQGGGIGRLPGSNVTPTITHSIVAGNGFEPTVTNGAGPDVFGSFVTQRFNLIGIGAGSSGLTDGINGDRVGTTAAPIDPRLGPLQPNGGPTKTHALLAGSPAIDQGAPNFNPPPATDQRGPGYARVQGLPASRADVGAFEVQHSLRAISTAMNGGAAQRSMVTSLTVAFNATVTFASTAGTAFALTRIGGGPVSFTATASNVTGATVVTFGAFTGAETTNGSLNDGRYTLTALAAQITANGLPLDGDGNGAGGDNYVFADSGQATGNQLYRFFGDVNGDRFVNGADFALFRTAFGTQSPNPNYNAAFDLNGDGFVNGADFADFRTRFGSGI